MHAVFCILDFTQLFYNPQMMFKLATFICLTGWTSARGVPSSLLQIGSGKPDVGSDVMANIQKEVAEFHKQMEGEILADKDEVRKLHDMQRKMERDDEAFKAKIFGRRGHKLPGSMLQTNSHFGDPYIDEAMRVIGDEIANEKRDLERVIAAHSQGSSMLQEAARRPELGLIASALKTRIAMVGKN